MTIDLNAIRKRAEAATEGPWQVNEHDYCAHKRAALVTNNRTYVAKVFAGEADATFIAHARQDVPALIAEVERLRTQQDRLIAELEKADKFSDELRAELFRQQLPGIRKLAEDYVKQRKEDD